MNNKKRIVVLVGGMILIAVLLALFVSRQESNNSSNQDEAPIMETKVGVGGLDKVLPQVAPISETAIQAALKGIIRMNVENPKENYQADFREGSFTTSAKPSGAPLKRFLVDIPELERSFVIEITGSEQYGSTTLYALCPQQSEIVYKPQACKDTP